MGGFEGLVEAVRSCASERKPAIVGIAGPVAAGKTTVARALVGALTDVGTTADIIGTDAFLHPNAVLAARGLEMRKGFPESFDDVAIVACLQRIRGGAHTVTVPVYSHATYDIEVGRSLRVSVGDVVVLEGVNALQAPVVDALDLAVYVDAHVEAVRRWFTDRLLALVDAARDDESSFYRGFIGLDTDAQRSFADAVWTSINEPNLREHIEPSKAAADVVVHKGADHDIEAVVSR